MECLTLFLWGYLQLFVCFKLADFSGFHPPMKIYAELRE